MTTIIQKKAGHPSSEHFHLLREEKVIFRDRVSTICETPGQPRPRVLESARYWFAFLGAIWFENQAISLEHLERLFDREIQEQTAQRLNGHFFLFGKDKKSGATLVMNDRFNSQLFFSVETESGWYFSTDYAHVRNLGSVQTDSINEARVYEFIKFRRLFGLDTYHDQVQLLKPAATIWFTPDANRVERGVFWRPTYQERQLGSAGWQEQISTAIRDSVEKYFLDGKDRGLMLSGGLDARALLSVGRERYRTFTNVEKPNNESRIANQLAESVGASHELVTRPTDYFDRWFDEAVACSSGMTVFHEAQFVGYEASLTSLVSRVDLGLALDIFFCGHYLPKYHPTLAGRSAWHFKLKELPASELGAYFMDNVSYRLKSSDPDRVFQRSARVEYRQILMEKIDALMESGRCCGASGYDLWEYMHLFNFGRHYSMLMANSLRRYLDVGIPALDNTVYQCALDLPVKLKYNWRAYIGALKWLDHNLLRIRNSNTNIRADRSLYTQTGIKAVRGLANMFIPGSATRTPPYWDRSWPLTKSTLEQGNLIRKMLLEIESHAKLFELSSIDADSVRTMIREYLAGAVDHSILINMLLTIEYGVLRRELPAD